MIVERQIFFRGRVQGVGFRYAVKQIAMGYEVTGWVRNLPDGRVELQVRGDASEVEDFLEAISIGQLQPFIRQREEGTAALLDGNTTGFEIRV